MIDRSRLNRDDSGAEGGGDFEVKNETAQRENDEKSWNKKE
jgi:hypothetical protein